MRDKYTGKQNGIVRRWEPEGEITIYTAKNEKLHGLCIQIGPGDKQTIKV